MVHRFAENPELSGVFLVLGGAISFHSAPARFQFNLAR